MVAIKDFEMPKSCADCKFGRITWMNKYRKCKITKNCYSLICTSDERPSDCPLVEIKEQTDGNVD